MLEKWDLTSSASEKDRNRWRLRIKIPEDEVNNFLNELSVDTGRPFSTSTEDYNWGVYIYNLIEKEKEALINSLKEKCPEGHVVVSGKETGAGTPAHEKTVKPKPDETPVSASQSPGPFDFPAIKKEPEEPKDDFWKIRLVTDYTFEEFVIGPNNRFTAAASMAVAENPGKVYNPLFIYGGVGLGKTHLMQAIGHYAMRKNPRAKIFYVTSEKFISEVIDSIGQGRLQQFRDRYRQLDILLVDDVQFLTESESTQEEFFHTFNILHQSGKQIVLTSDRPPKQLTTLEDRLRSRFEWGLIADIKSPSLETRVAILKRKGEHENVLLDDNMLLYIASKLKSNIRELEGFLMRINAYATITGQVVDMKLVKELMDELLPGEAEQKEAAPVQLAGGQQGSIPHAVPAPAQQIPVPAQVQHTPTPASPAPAGHAVSHPPLKPVVTVEDDMSLNPIEIAFFYPEGKENELLKVKERFRDIIKKHNLKFRLASVFDRSYEPHLKLNYGMFTELCKTNNVNIAVVVGPTPESLVTNDDFMNTLIAMMDSERISLQYIPWHELNKDYRYLNLALDITLTKHSRM
ncbi:MAG: chromosomal replication initiator protein DnaA [Elusimicrobiota bacterium]